MAIAYFQPITRGELSQFLGREVSRDAIAALRGEGFIAAGPRSPTPGAPYAYVTTPGFLAQFGFESLRDLPDIEKLEDAGLLGRTSEALLDGDALASELRGVLGHRAMKTSPRRMRRRKRNNAGAQLSFSALVSMLNHVPSFLVSDLARFPSSQPGRG